MKTPRLAPASLATAAFVALALAAQDSAPRIAYRFDEVKSKVLRLPGGDAAREHRVEAGAAAEEGDAVRTGFWGRTILSVPGRACRFEVFSSTRVRLAGGEPGVVLVLESGRLEAFFDSFTGAADQRRVASPGALLVVRGTRYGLEVDGDGNTTVAVFEGTVEAQPTTRGAAPLLVGPGEYGVFGPGAPPRKGRMGAGADEGAWRNRGAAALSGSAGQGQDPSSQRGPASQGRGGTSQGRGGH